VTDFCIASERIVVHSTSEFVNGLPNYVHEKSVIRGSRRQDNQSSFVELYVSM
jgi:hypothetical protein